MINKRFLIFGFFLFASITFFAQKDRIEYLPSFDRKRIHYGFYLGINNNDFKISLKDVTAVPNADITIESTVGFNVGLITDLRLHKNLNLRFEPGLMANSKKIYFNHLAGSRDSIREVNSNYLHIPLLLKFSADRHKNIRPYVLGGISYNENLSSNETKQDDNSSGQFRTKTNNFMYEVGIGMDIYLYYFKFSPSIRGIFAINNEIKYDENPNSRWTAPVNYLGTRGIFLTFAFE